MKQTAVEQLQEYLAISLGPDRMRMLANEFEKAKEMEKENIINFALQCMFGRTDIGSNLKNDFIKKYKETFKSE